MKPIQTETTEPRRVVIVGGGVAASRCALELRRLGFDGAVTMLSAEDRLPYDRTMLSKGMLADPPCELTELCTPHAYADRSIELRLATRAEQIDARGRRLRLSDGTDLDYDRLIVCTGGRPVVPAALAHSGAITVREAGDVAALRMRLASCQTLLVIGAGFIGAEIASSARARGIAVTLVEAASAPLVGILGHEVAARLVGLHREAGVELRCGSSARAIRRHEAGFEVFLDDGAILRGDGVVLGVGMAPQVGWLDGFGTPTIGGLITDAWCRTEIPDVLAAGDCARWWHPAYRTTLHVEHWDTAGRHGAAAAHSVLGLPEPFAPLPFFWSDQHGVKLQWVGYAPEWDSVEVSDGDHTTGFVARYYRDGRLAAAFASNRPRAIAAARAELQVQLDQAAEAWTSAEGAWSR
ncbi:MAG: hypothetical protein GEU86_17650 [Actinophytocola sp.]|nr:hypothetical protein [Actinophytocola sp.]